LTNDPIFFNTFAKATNPSSSSLFLPITNSSSLLSLLSNASATFKAPCGPSPSFSRFNTFKLEIYSRRKSNPGIPIGPKAL